MSWQSLVFAIVLAMALVSLGGAQQSLPAQKILSQIAAGQSVHYDGIAITGDLDLSTLPGAQVPAAFALFNCTIPDASFEGITFAEDAFFWGSSFGNASFERATFLGRADFANTSFRQASFAGCTFYQPALFSGALFENDLSFEDTAFGLDASFHDVRFLGKVDFNYSDFDSYSYFAAAEFAEDAFFSDVDLSATSDFSAATFSGQANFIRSRLNEPYFGDVLFSGPAQFGMARFSGLTSFGGAVFADEAGFGLARFSDAAYFSGAHFQDLALFGLARFEDIVTFQDARFDGDLNFKSGSITSLLFDEAELKEGSRIILNDTEINLFRAHWKEIQDHVAWQPGAYLALVENYRRLGWLEDEDDCYYQYRKLDQASKGWGWSKTIDILAWLSCGYGVRPSYAMVWSLVTILIFGLVFWIGDGIRRSSKPLSGPVEKDSIPERATLRNALFFSTMIFLSQGPIDFLPMGRHRYYVMLEMILGWLLLALFLVTLGKVMIR
ncbi:MAG: pentapeptide repeat-containing protein [Methanothrix soehngenii]|nr:pentapeptide repeat-containing protein [Methanothrix soehngenii]